MKSEDKLSPQERQQINELRALKKEFRDKGRPDKAVTIDNLLMKKCGADFPYRYDAFPPDHYLFDARHAKTAREKVMAWVYMGTIALGRNSPFVVNEYGNAQDVEDLAVFNSWGIKFAESELYSAECDGLLRRDPEIKGKARAQIKRRIWICAKVALAHADSKVLTENEECIYTPHPPALSPFVRCEPYLKKRFEALPLVAQADFLACHLAINEAEGKMESDALAATRTIGEYLHHLNWSRVGIEMRDGRKTRAHPAQPSIDDPLKVSAGYVQLSLAGELPETLLPPAPETAANGNQVAALRRHRDQIWELWNRAPEGPREDLLKTIIDALDARIEALLDAAPPPPKSDMDAVQAPTSGQSPKNEEGIHAKKSNIHTPTSLLPTLTPKDTLIRETVEIRDTVRQSHADRPTKAQAETQKAGEKKTPPMKAATRPEPASEDRSAILDDPEEKKAGTPAARPASKEHTGLTGTPSIEHRRRLKQISDTIPDELAERLGENKHSLPLLKQIEFALRGSTQLDLLSAAIAKADRAGKFNPPHGSLGLIISLAVPIGENWIRGAPEREKQAAAAERARVAEQAEQQKRGLLAEYSRHNEAAAEALYRALKPVDLGERQTAVKAQLRREGRLQRMALDVQAREIKQLILLDLARALPTFDEWRHQTKGATS